MKTLLENTKEPQQETVQRVQQEFSTVGDATIADNRPDMAIQRKLRSAITGSGSEDSTNPIQRKNNTGLPDNLKSGIENLSGYSMDDVKVHYNSNKPAQLQAHAYAQGTYIHLAPGQEKHLPHEAWHVVQQKQGRVKPTRQLKSKVNINDDVGLEKEADVMGQKALGFSSDRRIELGFLKTAPVSEDAGIQRKEIKNNGLTVAGEFHSKPDEQRQLEVEFVKEVKGASAQVWTENKMPGSTADIHEASEMPEHLLLSGIDRIRHYTRILMKELSKKNPLTLASQVAISVSLKALYDAYGGISDDLRNVFSGKTVDPKNDPYLALQKLKLNEFFITIISSDTKNVDAKEKATLLDNHKSFLRNLERLDESVSTSIDIPEHRNISHNFIRSRRMNEVANEKKDSNGVWFIGQYHVQEIQEHFRDDIDYELFSMKDFKDSIREHASKHKIEWAGSLNNKAGEVLASARIIGSSLKFFTELYEQWDTVRLGQEEKVDFEVHRLIEHFRFLNTIKREDLIAIQLSMGVEMKSKLVDDILRKIKTLKGKMATIPFLKFLGEYLSDEEMPKLVSLILKSISKERVYELVSDLEKLASVAK